MQCDKGFETYHAPSHSAHNYPVSFPTTGDRDWAESLASERRTKRPSLLFEHDNQIQSKVYRNELVDDVQNRPFYALGSNPGLAMGIPAPVSSYDMLYNSVAQAELSRGQVAFPSANFGIDPKNAVDRQPETPQRPSFLPRLRRMASFNSKRDTLTSPTSKEQKPSGRSRREDEDREWSSPAPKKTPRTPVSGGSRSKVIAGIEITVTPPSAHPGTTQFPAESFRTPTRRRRVYDDDYLSPTYSGTSRRLTDSSQSSSSSMSSSFTGSPVRMHRKKNGQ